MAKKQKSLSLDEEAYQEVSKIAKELNTSVSALVGEFLENIIIKYNKSK